MLSKDISSQKDNALKWTAGTLILLMVGISCQPRVAEKKAGAGDSQFSTSAGEVASTSDVTLEMPSHENRTLVTTIFGYEYDNLDDQCPFSEPGMCEMPLYRPYNRNTPQWWDNAVDELLFSRLHVVLAHGRGCDDKGNGDEGNGNMCPRLLRHMVAAIDRAGARSLIRLGMFDDTGAYPGTRKSHENLPNDEPLDFSNVEQTLSYMWERNVKIWYDTVPKDLWFLWNGRPIISFWSAAPVFMRNIENGGAKRVLGELRRRFQERYGLNPIFILDDTWFRDRTLTPTDAEGQTGWFNPSAPSNGTYSIKSWGGKKWTTTVPSFKDTNNLPGCGAACREQPRNGGSTLRRAFDSGRDAAFIQLEGFTNLWESAAFYRSPSWEYPNLYLNIIREYSDPELKTLRFQSEGADTYSDSDGVNQGGAYRRGGIDVSALPGSGWAVTHTQPGEWIEYQSVLTPNARYKFTGRLAASVSDARVHLEVDGQNLGVVRIPRSTNASEYHLLSLGSVSLSPGRHNFRLVFETSGVHSDYIFMKLDNGVVDQPPPPPPPPVPPSGLRAGFLSHAGFYLCAEGGGGREVVANRRGLGPWETWSLTDRNGGKLQSGDTVHLASHLGGYFVAENGGGSVVNANRSQPGTWETFTLMKLGGSGEIRNGDTVALQSVDGYFVVAEEGGGGLVNANRTGAGPWESFVIEFVR